MKKYLKIIIVILLVTFCCGCSKSSVRKINVLNWSSYIPDTVIKDFEDETGIIVNYQTYSSNEELLAKISGARRGTYDLIFPSDYMVILMRKRGIIQKLDKSRVSNYKNLNSNYLGLDYDKNNNYSLPFLAATTLIAYNSKNIKDNITSYNDLLNSNYKNNIVILDDQRTIIGIALLANGYDMNSTKDSELEVAKKWLLKLKPNLKAYDSDSPKTFLISRECDIGLLWNAEAAMTMQENKDIKVVYPKEGLIRSIDNFVIPKGGKHRKDIYKFINYLLRAEVMKKIIDAYPYKNVNSETSKLLDVNYLNNKAANVSDSLMRDAYEVKNIGKNIAKYDKLWAEIK
jgi:spermidine/putrescine-binding protein